MDDPGSIPLQLRPLLGTLLERGVEFVLIGGLAGLVHGSAYPTYDLDVAYARESPNLERLAAALQDVGVTLRGAPADSPFIADTGSLEAGSNFTFDTRFGMFDILGDVAGIRSYEELRAASVIRELDGLVVRVASIDHLIAMKRAANRPKDRVMLEEYIVLADELARREDG